MERTASATDRMPGRVLADRYQVGRRIARGGMATVYQATDMRLGRTAAVKIMHPAYAEDPDFVRRFQREARSAAQLSHPNIVAVFDQGVDDETGAIFLTMEYVPGRTLRDLLQESGTLSPTIALAVLEPVLSALSAAHGAGLVHRDVKPENVLLGPATTRSSAGSARRLGAGRGGSDELGVVKVADFGLARAAGGSSTATGGMLIGTVSYLAPEQLTSGIANARGDVYAAGIVLFEMLTGAKPHTAETPIQVAYQHVHTDVPPPSDRIPGLPAYLDALVIRSTARDADVRPADAGVLLHHVRRARSALAQGCDDPELTEDLLAFRAAPQDSRADHAGSEQGRAAGAPGESRRPPLGTGPNDTAVVPHDGPLLDVRGRPGGHGDPSDGDRSRDLPVRHSQRGRGRIPGGAAIIRRRRTLLALLVAGTLIAGSAAYMLGFVSQTAVPPLLEKTRAELAEVARDTGLTFEVEGRIWHRTVPSGGVARSSPEPGARVPAGSTVSVWLSRGPERHRLPDLVGRTENAGRRALNKLGLQIADIERVYDDNAPDGRIIATTPDTGTVLIKGSGVRLTVSRGPAPVEIPTVVGQVADEVRATLTDLGLDVAITEAFSDEVATGRIIAQRPEPGTGHRGDTVELTVSKGPEFVTVPAVRGKPVDEAEAELTALGLEVKVERTALYVGADLVVSQSPTRDSRARIGSVVTLGIV